MASPHRRILATRVPDCQAIFARILTGAGEIAKWLARNTDVFDEEIFDLARNALRLTSAR
jgi:hypothetical protein